MGECCLWNGKIQISEIYKGEPQTDSSQFNTFYHELTHAILDTMGEYGRIGQLLREHEDMKVVRHRSLKIDGIVGTGLDNFVSFSSNNFGILEDYKQKQIDEKTFEDYKVGQHFVIDIPFE